MAEKRRIESLITSEPKKRAFSMASEKGSSSWLSALPLRSLGYCLNKKDFRDSLLLLLLSNLYIDMKKI